MRNLFKKVRKQKIEKRMSYHWKKEKVDQKLEGKGANTIIRATQSKVKVFFLQSTHVTFSY
jgi:hypothetical protein